MGRIEIEPDLVAYVSTTLLRKTAKRSKSYLNVGFLKFENEKE